MTEQTIESKLDAQFIIDREMDIRAYTGYLNFLVTYTAKTPEVEQEIKLIRERIDTDTKLVNHLKAKQ
jgi:hypothetical protein